MPIPPKQQAEKKTQSRLRYVGEHFDEFQKNGDGYKAICPTHDDNKPSLSIRESGDGKILVHCHAGCPTNCVLEVVGLSYRDLYPTNPVIVAEHDYTDEQGEILYQAVRMDPKSFRQRRPDPQGGWIWKLEDTRRVLYRLPELNEANPKLSVLVVEGEKDVDRLWKEGFVATCNVGGAGKWRSEYNETLEGRHVVIVPDNDKAGRDHANKVAANLKGVAKSIKIVDLPGLPDKGDVSDWLDLGGTAKKLRALIRSTPPIDPSPIGSKKPKNAKGKNPSGRGKRPKSRHKREGLPDGSTPRVGNPMGDGSMGKEFPTDVFPVELRMVNESIAKALPCPVDFPGTMMLPVLGSLVGRKRCISVKPGWVEYPLIWAAVIARSGDRKSPSFDKVTEPLRQRQKVLQAEYYRAKAEYKALSREEREKTSPPTLEQVLTTDTTIEALKGVLQNQPNGIIYPADELSGWIRSLGQYKGGHGDDRQLWLSIWSGQQIVCNRKGDPEPTIINNPFVAITGGIQPDALKDIVGTREDGLSARFLYSFPNPIENREWTEDVVEQSPFYRSLCDQLYEMEPKEEPVMFGEGAKRVWIEWVNAHRLETPPDYLLPTWAKAEGYCLRLTLIVYLVRRLCNKTKSASIDSESIEGGIKLIEYYKCHAHRAYSEAAQPTNNHQVDRTLHWIRKQGGKATARLAAVNGFTKNSAEAKELYTCLDEEGYGTVTSGKQGSVIFTLSEGN